MDKTKKKNELQVYKADLHIHTPASKCYKGNNEDREYIRILEKASEKGLNIIAITDHNSIEGYKKLIEQKEKKINEIEAYRKIGDSNEAKNIIRKNEKTLKLFDSILILPGVEFEVNNGIHMLVIFSPETEISTINEFLKAGGFDNDSFGKETDVFSNWSLFNFYEEVKKYDCLIFDAHTDSNKGIYNTLEGTTRVHAFTDDVLVGICYKSEKQKSCIQKLFLDPKYKRNSQIAFLKSSDAHKTDEIGKEKTFFRINKLTWQDLKNAFSNPDECIFTSNPKVQTIINSISNTGRCVYIQNIDECFVEQFARSVCGLCNAEGGYIILGAETKDVVNGIELKKDEDTFQKIEKFIDETLEKVGKIPLSINPYPLKEDYIICIVKINKSDNLLDIDKNGDVYYYNKGNVEKLNASYIQQILSQRIEAKYQQQITKELSIIKKNISAVETYLKSQPILSSYRKNSLPIGEYISSIDLIEPAKFTAEQEKTLNENYKQKENGCLKGNVIYINSEISPRLKDAYLRITPPKFNMKSVKKISDNKCLYIIPGGAVFYSESELNYYNKDDMPILKLTVDEYPIKFLCSFLKSSFYLWYIKNKFGDFDFFSPKIFNGIYIPALNLQNPSEKKHIENIEKNVDKIIELEKSFLKIDWKSLKHEQTNELVINHNNKTKELFVEIDNVIFGLNGQIW